MCINVSFQRYQWLYPGIYQALHPIATILADLWNRPFSSEAPTSRLLMDRVFSLLGPDGGIVTEADNSSTRRHLSAGGKKAWYILYKMIHLKKIKIFYTMVVLRFNQDGIPILGHITLAQISSY